MLVVGLIYLLLVGFCLSFIKMQPVGSSSILICERERCHNQESILDSQPDSSKVKRSSFRKTSHETAKTNFSLINSDSGTEDDVS